MRPQSMRPAAASEPRYEAADIDSRRVGLLGIALLATLGVIAGLVWRFEDYLSPGVRPRNSTGFVAPAEPLRFQPQTPELQVTPRDDYDTWHAQQLELLTKGTKAGSGPATLPIDDAMEAFVQRCQPAKAEGPK